MDKLSSVGESNGKEGKMGSDWCWEGQHPDQTNQRESSLLGGLDAVKDAITVKENLS